jgi:DNA-binding protein H-NS
VQKTKLELTNLSISELIKLRDELDGMIVEKARAEKKLLLERIRTIQQIEHSTLERERRSPSRPERSLKKGGVKAIPKYQDPKTGQTWAGRGKQPRWLRKAIEAGTPLEDFRIRTQTD